VFQPAKKRLTTAFVFYPGGRVDYRSYAAPLHKIAAEGYLVILLPVRLNLAALDVNAADQAIAAFPEIRHWVVGGHSLGGSAAATYASTNHDLGGVVFWASYPANDTLKNTDMKVLSIYGTLDMGGVNPFEASRANLPSDSEFVVIEGGNHSQFGDYGLQPGDTEATIPREEQQKQVVDATVKFLKEVSE
jgi:pimeloyl-ACP methyl ester carboxylesterase